MSEGVLHASLVRHMQGWVAGEYFGGDRAPILIDDVNNQLTGRPPAIEGHVPDLFAQRPQAPTLIVGEAKTPADLETERSEKQILSFLRYCDSMESGLFVLAVPWHRVPLGRGLLSRLCRSLSGPGPQTRVIEWIPG